MAPINEDLKSYGVPTEDLESRLEMLLNQYDEVSSGDCGVIEHADRSVDVGDLNDKSPTHSIETAVSAISQTAGAICAPTINRRSITISEGIRSAKIMIVDDESAVIGIISQHLENAGFHNFVTTDQSSTALQLMHSEMPEVVLLDLDMPEVSGFDSSCPRYAQREHRVTRICVRSRSS